MNKYTVTILELIMRNLDQLGYDSKLRCPELALDGWPAKLKPLFRRSGLLHNPKKPKRKGQRERERERETVTHCRGNWTGLPG